MRDRAWGFFVQCKVGGGWVVRRILTFPALRQAQESPSVSLLLPRLEGEKASYYNDIGKEVTLPHGDLEQPNGEGRGMGIFPRHLNPTLNPRFLRNLCIKPFAVLSSIHVYHWLSVAAVAVRASPPCLGAPPSQLLQGGGQVFLELAEGASLGQGLVHLPPDRRKHVKVHRLGHGEGGGVFLAPNVPVIESDLEALTAEELQRLFRRVSREAKAGLGG